MSQESIILISLCLIDMLPQVRERINPESIVGLAMSIKEVGLQQAIRVRRLLDRFVVVDGHRRVLAALQLGLEKIAAIIEEEGLNDADIVQRQLIANIQREDLTNVERGRGFDHIMKLTGWSGAEVARRTGLSPATVSRDTAILTLPPDVLRRVESGEIKASTAYQIAIAGNSEEQSKLAEATANGRLPRDRVVELTRRSRRASQPRRVNRPKRERFTVRLGPGRSLTVSGPNLTLTSLTEWLQALLKRIGTMEPQDMALADAAKALAELRAAVTLPEANVPQPTVHGIAGTRTPGEVMLDKKLDVRDPDERPAILDKYFKQPETDRESNVREPEPREPERD